MKNGLKGASKKCLMNMRNFNIKRHTIKNKKSKNFRFSCIKNTKNYNIQQKCVILHFIEIFPCNTRVLVFTWCVILTKLFMLSIKLSHRYGNSRSIINRRPTITYTSFIARSTNSIKYVRAIKINWFSVFTKIY